MAMRWPVMGHDRRMDTPRRITRSTSNRVLAGVCAGVADHLGVDPRTVRLVTAGLTVLGPGAPMYLLLWAFAPADTELPTAPVAPTRTAVPRLNRSHWLLVVGVLVLGVGMLSLGPLGSLDPGLGFLVPFGAILVGALVAWSQLDAGATGDGTTQRAMLVARPAVGLALVVGGVVAVAAQGGNLSDVVRVAVSALVVLAGAVVIASPWVIRLWRRLQQEQAERVRATERAEVAAHLHDSVLQTLALIQRRSDDPAAVARLARSQERELRGWLYGAARGADPTSLAAAVRAVVEEVEDAHGIPVELVATGDAPVEEATEALVGATREALLNAVRHGAAPVTVYLEAGAAGAEVFVRDHGPGFDPEAVPPDRLGVRESIIGRMSRHGGSGRVRRLDDGTEVALVMPVVKES